MTFIIARKVEGLVFFIADTFSRNDLTQEGVNRFTDPLFKIIKLRNEYVVAYAGNAISAQSAFDEIETNSDISVLQYLEQIHNQFLQDEDRYVEFAVSSIVDMDLWFIKNGKVNQSSASFLGEADGMNIFHEEYTKPSSLSGSGISVLSVPNHKKNIPEESIKMYSDCVHAFHRVMSWSKVDYGGIALTYVIYDGFDGFMTSAQNHRGKITKQEIGGPISFQDSISSGFMSIVGGEGDAVSIHYPGASYGVIFLGFSNDPSMRGITFKNIDPYDFAYEAEQRGGIASIRTWNSYPNDLRKCYDLINRGLEERAETLFEFILTNLAKDLELEVPDNVKLPFANGVIHRLKKQNSISCSIRTIQWIEEILKLQLRLAEVFNKNELIEQVHQELNSWVNWIEGTKVQFTIVQDIKK